MLHIFGLQFGLSGHYPCTVKVKARGKECLQSCETSDSGRDPPMSFNGQMFVLGFFLSSVA